MERGKTWRGYPALSKPLTIMGVERRWFLLSATLGLALWNAINSIVVGALWSSTGRIDLRGPLRRRVLGLEARPQHA